SPLRDADVEGLARVYDIGERLHRLLQRRRDVVSMRLIEVDVIGVEPGQGAVDRLQDVLARKAAVVGSARTGRPEDLGEDLDRLSSGPVQGPSEHRLRGRVGVRVGCVEGGDALIEGLSY